MRKSTYCRQRLAAQGSALVMAAALAFGLGGVSQAQADQSKAETVAGRASDDVKELRRSFSEWWNQPPGPSASGGFVRQRASARQREKIRREAMLRRQEVDRLLRAGSRNGAPTLAPLPRPAPPDARARAAAASLASRRVTASQGPRRAATLQSQAPGPQTAAASTAAIATVAALNPAETTPAATPQDQRAALASASARREARDVAFRSGEDVALLGPTVLQPAPTRAEGGLAPAALSPAEQLVDAAGMLDGPLAALADASLDESLASPAPAAAPETIETASTAPEKAGLLADPTIRIGIAFLVGLSLLALAFLREWSGALRRRDA